MPSATPFSGYPQPTSNTTYTPNQFFDVVLPHASRGAVRLVAYMLRKVLGWSDSEGHPQQPTVLVSYKQLEQEAGIGHSMIRAAIDEAVAKRYIRCVRTGSRNARGSYGSSALFELRWDERDQYLTDPDTFDGFYSGNGNLTYIPNAFFDYTIRQETLAVVKVIGAIIRHTIGFQTRYGFRRQQVAMPFSEIQRRANIPSPGTLNDAIRQAIANNHIVRVEEGCFDPDAGKRSKATVYAVKWAGDGMNVEPVQVLGEPPVSGELPETGDMQTFRETVFTEVMVGVRPALPTPNPGDICPTVTHRSDEHTEKHSGAERENTPKNIAGNTPKNIAAPNPQHTEKHSGNSPKNIAVEHTEKRSDIQITDSNNTREITQQQGALPAGGSAAAVLSPSLNLESGEGKQAHAALLRAGFDRSAADLLLTKTSPANILRQIGWLDRRKASHNRLGLLRKSIEEQWPEPPGAPSQSTNSPDASGSFDGSGQDEETLFCHGVYAAWSGSEAGVGVPSAGDRSAASSLLARLREEFGEGEGAAGWGKAFGGFVRRQTTGEGSRRIPRSVVLAGREVGDLFVEELTARRRQGQRQSQEADRRTHETAFRADWLAYVAAQMGEIAVEAPEAFAAFDAEDQNRRRGAIKFTARLVPDALERFDAPEARQIRFVEFFQTHHGRQILRPAEVLDFWSWDARLNSQGWRG